MRHINRTVVLALAAIAVLALLALFATPSLANSAGGAHFHSGQGHDHGHWHHGPHWRWGVGIGFGFGPGYYYPEYGPPYSGPLLVAPAPMVGDESLAGTRAPRAPDPVIEPRNGQSAAQTEADRQACNRWATTQANAMADASVFHRATLACMEARGYSVR